MRSADIFVRIILISVFEKRTQDEGKKTLLAFIVLHSFFALSLFIFNQRRRHTFTRTHTHSWYVHKRKI